MGFEIRRNTSSIIKGSVELYSDLSNISNPSINDYYLVRKGSGIPFVNRKSSGLYYWNGTEWKDDDQDIINKIATIESSLQNKADTNHAHTESDITDLDKYSQQEIDDKFNNYNVITGLGYTPEDEANKATNFVVINDVLYPTTKAVYDYIESLKGSDLVTLDGNGKIDPTQIPDLAITDVISASENNLPDFITNNSNYNYQTGDVIIIDNGNGDLTHYMFDGGDKSNSASYSLINASVYQISQVDGLQSILDSLNNNKLDKNGDGSQLTNVDASTINSKDVTWIDNNVKQWTAIKDSSNNASTWYKVATFSNSAIRGSRALISYSGGFGYSSGNNAISDGGAIYITRSNASAGKLFDVKIISSLNDGIGQVIKESKLTNNGNGTSSVYARVSNYSGLSCFFQGGNTILSQTHSNTIEEPVSGYDLTLLTNYHSGNSAPTRTINTSTARTSALLNSDFPLAENPVGTTVININTLQPFMYIRLTNLLWRVVSLGSLI